MILTALYHIFLLSCHVVSTLSIIILLPPSSPSPHGNNISDLDLWYLAIPPSVSSLLLLCQIRKWKYSKSDNSMEEIKFLSWCKIVNILIVNWWRKLLEIEVKLELIYYQGQAVVQLEGIRFQVNIGIWEQLLWSNPRYTELINIFHSVLASCSRLLNCLRYLVRKISQLVQLSLMLTCVNSR